VDPVTLANGAELVVSEKHDLPLVSVTITFSGGYNQADPVARRGLADMTAAMMSEGTKNEDGEALAAALQLLGTMVTVRIAGETGTIALQCIASQVSGDARHRRRHARQPVVSAGGTRAAARPAPGCARPGSRPDRCDCLARVPATRVWRRSPYGQNVTEATLKAITRDDVVAFHHAYFRPGQGAGDGGWRRECRVAKASIEKALAAWPRGGEKPAFQYPSGPRHAHRRFILADKPGAAQSTFAIGTTGPPRSTPDYFALQVMNTDSRRHVSVAAECEHPRREGLQLRRRFVVRVRKGPGVPRRAATSSRPSPTPR
jgi:zinc protease